MIKSKDNIKGIGTINLPYFIKMFLYYKLHIK